MHLHTHTHTPEIYNAAKTKPLHCSHSYFHYAVSNTWLDNVTNGFFIIVSSKHFMLPSNHYSVCNTFWLDNVKKNCFIVVRSKFLHSLADIIIPTITQVISFF